MQEGGGIDSVTQLARLSSPATGGARVVDAGGRAARHSSRVSTQLVDQVAHEERQIPLRQPVAEARRQQPILALRPKPRVSSLRRSENQPRSVVRHPRAV